ncbi:MAG TPA: hypothetical protein VGC14_02780 [Rhizobium sp.]
MQNISPPKIVIDHPDRDIECQEALSDAFIELTDRARAAGWLDQEVAAALGELADNWMLALIHNDDLDVDLDNLKKRD